MDEPGDRSANELDAFLGTSARAPWRRWLLWLTIAGGTVVFALLAMRFASGGQAGSYISEPLEIGDVPVGLDVTGTLEASATSAAGTAQAGVVGEVRAAKGDRVVQGQLLARLDTRPFLEALAGRRRALTDRRETLARAQDVERGREARLQLFQQVRRRSGGTAPSEREMAQAREELARASETVKAVAASVVTAQADVAAASAALAATEVRAPMGGVVVQTSAAAGRRLGTEAAGALLFVIAAPYSQLDLSARIDGKAAARLPAGASVRVTVADVPGQVFAGRLIGVGGGRAAVRVASSGRFLRPGMAATAHFDLGLRRNVLFVPNAALEFAQASDARLGTAGGSAVYVLDSDGAPRRVGITAAASDGKRTEVVDGALTPGTRVILGLR
ncbi:secretion protein HlyD [Polymorphobacter glacialis]|uniref:Secretion protein HlyD n=1 Tax=Sandarakinorhabdus glacialis TaxID=1614636 RepID=A0A916ZKN6_9SPHN|nr:efflux RND transporter periplasmic adaptor subunit [Polymorphobacter glacialis]GGE02516.1 secretion protein HlyD [Polymorphobacter glacialis]